MNTYRIYKLFDGKIVATLTSEARGASSYAALKAMSLKWPRWFEVEGDEILVVEAHGIGTSARPEQALFRIKRPTTVDFEPVSTGTGR